MATQCHSLIPPRVSVPHNDVHRFYTARQLLDGAADKPRSATPHSDKHRRKSATPGRRAGDASHELFGVNQSSFLEQGGHNVEYVES